MGSDSAGIDFALDICNQFNDNDCQRDWFSDESPQHQVYLDGYWVMKTEMTNAQFRAFVDGGGYTTQRYWTSEGWQWRSESSISQPSQAPSIASSLKSPKPMPSLPVNSLNP